MGDIGLLGPKIVVGWDEWVAFLTIAEGSEAAVSWRVSPRPDRQSELDRAQDSSPSHSSRPPDPQQGWSRNLQGK